MNQKQAKKRRYNAKLQYVSQLEKWLAIEPPFWNFWAWRKWAKRKPNQKEVDYETL